jgi:RNA polymerase sigma-70 factor (ECF subfamily)
MLSAPKTQPLSNQQEEARWVENARSNPVAFRPLYERYFRAIFMFVLHRVGDRGTAADLTQQVFTNALVALKKYESRGLPFSSWLYRIALNQCNDYFRKQNRLRHVVMEESDLLELHRGLMESDSLQNWEAALPQVLARLPEKDLELIELRFFEQRPFKEIAEILSISEVYAKVRTYRILDRMKIIFQEVLRNQE